MFRRRCTFPVLLTLMILSWGLPAALHAVPAAPGTITLSQPDGTLIQARQWGDENLHGLETPDGYTILQETAGGIWAYATKDGSEDLRSSGVPAGTKPPPGLKAHLRPALGNRARRSPAAAGEQRVVPSTGTANVPVILVNFNNRTTTYTPADFTTLLFGTGTHSMKDYYSEVSYGQFTVGAGPSGIAGWYTASRGHDYYGANDTSGYDAYPGTLVREAVAAADASFDFAAYDSDGDCYVDVVNIVHQGTGEEAGGLATDIWSHSWDLESAYFYNNSDGGEYVTQDTCVANPSLRVKVNNYVIQPETLYAGMGTMGVFAHEYGHALGLPDLYDTDYSSEGAGAWSVMASGSWNGISRSGDRPAHPDAWCKYYLGWINPAAVTTPLVNEPIDAASTAGDVYRILPGTPTAGEYFLVENRELSGFDAGLPAAGLLVWHIDGDWIASHYVNNDVNNDECYPGGPSCASQHYGVALVQADNGWALERGYAADGGDPYPGSAGNRVLDGASLPGTALWDGSPSGASITAISNVGAPMTATLEFAAGDLEITLGADSLSVPQGGGAVVIVGVDNHGPLDQTGVTVTGVLPIGLDYMSDDCGGTLLDRTWSWSVGSLANGVSATCRLTAQVNSPCPLVGTATVTGEVVDPPFGNSAAITLNDLAQVVEDPGFEAGSPSPSWSQHSRVGYDIIWEDSGNAHGGSWLAWFGGYPLGQENGTLTQAVTIPSGGGATMSFWLWIGQSGNSADFLRVLVGNNEIFKVFAGDATYTAGYVRVLLNLDRWADGASHNIKFKSATFGGAISSFFVDDVTILPCADPSVPLFQDNFSDGGAAGDPQWTVRRGAWSVNAGRRYQSTSSRRNLATVTLLDPVSNPLGAGRIQATLRMTALATGSPNAALVFAYQDPTHYRYVRLKPGHVYIGQAGDFGGDTAGRKVDIPGTWRTQRSYQLTLDILAGGTVKLGRGGVTLAEHTFGGFTPGGVGFQATRAQALFDDIYVWDDAVLP